MSDYKVEINKHKGVIIKTYYDKNGSLRKMASGRICEAGIEHIESLDARIKELEEEKENSIQLEPETIKKLQKCVEWDRVSIDGYIKTLMQKCPFPFGC